MKGAARKLVELSEQGEAAAERAAREHLRIYGEIIAIDAQSLFGHTVREHRATLESLDRMLGELCVGCQWVAQVAISVGFAKDAEATVRAADVKLRVLRALASLLLGDRAALDGERPEVRAEVDREIEKHAAVAAGRWTKEERDAFGGKARPLSPELEARIIGS